MKKIVLKLIRQYVDGWKQNNLQKITSCLTENCVVIESHGTTYNGIQDIERWFALWLKAKNVVTKWDILSFYCLNDEKTAFFEWGFSCVSGGKKYNFPGISIVRFADEKISFIHEYKMTNPAYVWQRDELRSE